MPEDRHKWSFETAGHLPYFADHIDELKGYDLLDTFIPGFGDAFTANIPRLLTGTPYGPIDFVYSEAASLERMKSYGLLAFLGHAEIDAATGARLRSAVEAGSNLLLGVQHVLSHPQAAFSLEIGPETARHVSGNAGSFHFEGEVYPAPAGWDTVVRVGDAPLAVKRRFRDGECVLFLGRWMHQGGAALRSVLAEMASRAAPLEFNHANDQMEYVAYRKSGGAWIALLNHGAIPVGCDRLRPLRAAAPGPLCSRVTGPWHGRISIKLAKLGLNPTGKWALFEVDGIDGEAFERVISGRENFRVRSIPAAQSEAALHAEITVNKRSQLVIAPPGGGEAVFFGVA